MRQQKTEARPRFSVVLNLFGSDLLINAYMTRKRLWVCTSRASFSAFYLQELKLHCVLVDLNHLFECCCARIGELTCVFFRISSHQFKVFFFNIQSG